MPKNIIFCADGTWDHPKSPVSVSDTDSNVAKLYNLLTKTADQMPFYDDGVGADGEPLQHLTGGALGLGLYQKIKDGYTAVAHVYDQDDRIFIFGFSRGAYTARALAGMIAYCGLPTGSFTQAMVEAAFNAYRDRTIDHQVVPTSFAGCPVYNAKITMVGVWDTVGALGIPAIVGGVDPILYGFLDTRLHPDVLNAYHAMAIDERRREFPVTQWTPPFAPGQTVDQVWFAGVHCDVGGGYPETGLSDITLSWILSKALALNLNVIASAAERYAFPLSANHALDTIHESWNPLWLLPKRRTIPSDATVASSVAIRLAGEIGYHPPNLTLTETGQLDPAYGIEAAVTSAAAAAA